MIFLVLLTIGIYVTWVIIYASGVLHYRLGDIICYEPFDNIFLKTIYSNYFPGSVAARYMSKTNKKYDYDALYEVVKECTKPKDIPPEDTLIVHLRVGDVIEVEHEGTVDELLEGKVPILYTKSYKYFEDNLKKIENENIHKAILVGYSHRTTKMSKTNEYIEKVKNKLEQLGYDVELRINKYSPDEDFLFMSNSNYFLKGGGGYSRIIAQMVKRNGKFLLTEEE